MDMTQYQASGGAADCGANSQVTSWGGMRDARKSREGGVGEPSLYRSEFEHDACGIGALAHLNGVRSHQMVDDALSTLVNLEHRGGTGLESNTGDGAGILLQVPHRFFRKEAQKCGCILPEEGDYGVAMLFFPRDEQGVVDAKRLFEDGCARHGLPLMFWREVPVDAHDLGETAKSCMPTILQAFLARPKDVSRGMEFERMLYVCRRDIEKSAHGQAALDGKIFYVCSMSARTIVYKGMLLSTQLRRFYRDLGDASTETAVALVHSRYSTNTTPSWERAHPNRFMVHNGEINTLRGNVNWIRAREPGLYSPVLGEDLKSVLPIIESEGSDSAMLDNVIEFMVMNGRSLMRSVSMAVPEPWDHNEALSERRRDWDAYQSMVMEAWDGPAALAFTDGEITGAALDRNGLRPARFYITNDDRLILSSEVGALDIKPQDILEAGCLGPGEVLMVDPKRGRVLRNDEVKDAFANEKPYRAWLDACALEMSDLLGDDVEEPKAQRDEALPLPKKMAIHGFRYDDIEEALLPMARDGKTPLASMGTDVALAVLSDKSRRLYDYFNQLFAQVTNPPIDALRESYITSTMLYVGNRGNFLEDTRANCRVIRLQTPLLTQREFNALCAVRRQGFKAVRLSAVVKRHAGPDALEAALSALEKQAEAAVREGANILALSDRVSEEEMPIPSVLAVGAVHNHLLRVGLRMRTDIIVESGDAITPHDFAVLVGYSASGICPYVAHECIAGLVASGALQGSVDEAVERYNRACVAGIVHIMAKMGISTMQGYHSAQVFEIVGLDEAVVNRCFARTVSRIGGLGLADIQRECEERYQVALNMEQSPAPGQLPSSGVTKWRPVGGEGHILNPQSIYLLQRCVRDNDYALFKEFSQAIHPEGRSILLRDLLEFAPGQAISIDEVEPASDIVRRFNTGAMSYGSISQEAHECIAIAMNRLGGRSNSGEGGENPLRETLLPNGDSKRSAIKQIASGRFGVTSRYLMSADEIQIKLAQGAKPGEGGHLPGKKVWPWIARVRRSTPGVGLISPPPHHDIYSIEDLAELIFDAKNANPKARISVKLVSEAGVGTIATGVAKGGAEKILISGSNGGTGAAPRDSIYHAGLPLELGLAETQQTLVRNGLRSRVVLEADGKLLDGRDVAMAALLGAEEFGFATGVLVSLGCLMQRDCQQDTCPVGIATQNCCLRNRFAGKPEYVERYLLFIAEQLREIMAQLGFRSVDEMVGRVDCLRQHARTNSWKAQRVDLSPLLTTPRIEFGAGIEGADAPRSLPAMAPDHHLGATLDATLLLPFTQDARDTLSRSQFKVEIDNVNRCVGTMLGSAVTAAHPEGLPEDSLLVECEGSAGMSFGAFLPAGVTFSIAGDANDYFGKGLSGGVLSIAPARGARYRPDENMAVGNVAFYGATGGKGFVNGLAGQRFGVRNSGATLVVEGMGACGCEYMTGGTVLSLGEVGMNFAAGMSGGVAYVYDEEGTLEARCNRDMVRITQPSEADIALIEELISEHVRRTQSPLGIMMSYKFRDIAGKFAKVIPVEYERVLAYVEEAESQGVPHDEAVEIALERMREGAHRG